MLSDLASAFQLDCSRSLPIPLHLEMLTWRSILAAFGEWKWELDHGAITWQRFNAALQRHFNFYPVLTYRQLKEQFEERYGALVDMSDKFWVYKGFRATASDGKIPLINGTEKIAWIEDIAIFRDAHPGAVYLAEDGRCYRVVDYQGHFKRGEWNNPNSDTILGKWLRTVDAVLVRPEPARILTRGTWYDSYKPWELAEEGHHLESPGRGSLKFGIWDYERLWTGYTERDPDSDAVLRKVDLKEATAMFAAAMDAGKVYPFLHRFSYRTLGWQWAFGRIDMRDPGAAPSLSKIVKDLLEHFIAAAVESKPTDLSVDLDTESHQLRVLDSAPGGNGLSEALLVQGRMLQALEGLSGELKKHIGQSARKRDQFESYLRSLRVGPSELSALELFDVVCELQMRWAR